MKKNYSKQFLAACLILTSGLFARLHAQALNWQWAVSESGTASAIAADEAGNVYMTGSFASSIQFDTIHLTPAGGGDIFLAKYNAQGNVIWAKSSGGTGGDQGNGVCTDRHGNVFITGSFQSPTIQFGTTTLTSPGGLAIFVAKYNAMGQVMWAKAIGGTTFDSGNSVATDSSGNVYVCGHFAESSLTVGTTILHSAGQEAILLVKYDPLGNVLWAKGTGGSSPDNANSVSTDKHGNVFITGFYQSASISFGTFTLTNTNTLVANVFVAGYDSTGNALWAQASTGSNRDVAYRSSTDSLGNVYVTGYFSSTSISFGTKTLTNQGNNDVFLVKYDKHGNVRWARSAGGPQADDGFGVCSDAVGNTYITGSFSSPKLIFGTDTLLNTVPSSFFIAKYDSAGTFGWARAVTDCETGLSVCADSSGDVYVTGSFSGTSVVIGTQTLSSIGPGNGNGFLAKLGKGVEGISMLSLDEALTVYPNPSSGQFTLRSTANELLTNSRLEVYDLMGQVVYSTKPVSGQLQLNLTQLPDGIYFVNLLTNRGYSVKKICINH